MVRRSLLAVALLLSYACSRDGAKTARLLVAVPMTGDIAASGQGIERGVRMAVEEETSLGGLPKIEVVVSDDRSDPLEAANVARRAVEDPLVFAVIGHLTSGCAIEASRVYARAPLAMITPSATATALTTQQDQPDWVGERIVFRLPPSDGMQGEFAADYAVKRLSLKRVFLVHDRTPYGLGLAENFRAGLERKGGTVTGFEAIASGDKDFSPVVKAIMAAPVDALFFGGIYLEAGLLIRQARAAGYQGAFLSGDATKNAEFFDTAGAAGDGAYVTVGGVPVEALPSAADFVERYQKRWAGAVPRTYDHYAYEAARVALGALRRAGEPDRKKVLKAVRATDMRAMVGDIAFDSKGDTLRGIVTMTKADFALKKFEVAY